MNDCHCVQARVYCRRLCFGCAGDQSFGVGSVVSRAVPKQTCVLNHSVNEPKSRFRHGCAWSKLLASECVDTHKLCCQHKNDGRLRNSLMCLVGRRLMTCEETQIHKHCRKVSKHCLDQYSQEMLDKHHSKAYHTNRTTFTWSQSCWQENTCKHWLSIAANKVYEIEFWRLMHKTIASTPKTDVGVWTPWTTTMVQRWKWNVILLVWHDLRVMLTKT